MVRSSETENQQLKEDGLPLVMGTNQATRFSSLQRRSSSTRQWHQYRPRRLFIWNHNGDLFQSNMQLLPFAISPLGLFGPTMNHFLFGKPPQNPLNNYTISITPNSPTPSTCHPGPHACSSKTPSNILQQQTAS